MQDCLHSFTFLNFFSLKKRNGTIDFLTILHYFVFQKCHLHQGRVIGGSSTLNRMLYLRGSPAVYNDWAENGGFGWSYKDVIPYFLKSEDLQIDDLKLSGIF